MKVNMNHDAAAAAATASHETWTSRDACTIAFRGAVAAHDAFKILLHLQGFTQTPLGPDSLVN